MYYILENIYTQTVLTWQSHGGW